MNIPIPHAAARALAESSPSPSWSIAPKAVDPATGEVRSIDRPPFVPEDVWAARESLARLRQLAAVRRKSPDALLGVVLARLGAQDYRLKLPPNGGEPVGLGFYSALVGPSGSGKSATLRLARHVVPTVEEVVEANTGTGEGLREAFFGEVEVDGHKERRQTRHGLILSIGEGSKLERLAGRKGTTHQDFFLSAWMDEQTGDRNASSDTTRELEPGRYAVSIVVGMQPARSAWFFHESEVGLPQRFLWMSAYAPPRTHGEAQDWPDGVEWERLGFLPDVDRGRQERLRSAWGGVAEWMTLLDVAGPVVREVADTQDAVAEGSLVLHDLDGHRLMVRLKTAALLARLEYRLDLTVEDWQLAGAVLEVSDGVRSWTLDKLADRSADEAAKRGLRAAEAEAAKADELHGKYLGTGARSIGRAAWRRGPITRSQAMQATSGDQRKLVPFDEMLDRALSDGYIVRDGDRFLAGSVDPR